MSAEIGNKRPWILKGSFQCHKGNAIYSDDTCDFCLLSHDDVTKWKHFPRYWPFVRGIHQSPVNSPHKGQWCGALMFTLICARINSWVNNREAGDLRCHRAHYDFIVMILGKSQHHTWTLQWYHNEHDRVPNHWCLNCLLKRLFRYISKKTSKLPGLVLELCLCCTNPSK